MEYPIEHLIEHRDRISIDSPFPMMLAATSCGSLPVLPARCEHGPAASLKMLKPKHGIIPPLTLGGNATRQGYPCHIAIPNCEMHAPTDAKADTGSEGR